MCGRYAITLPPDAMQALFRYGERPNFPPRYNIAPTQPVPVVRIHDGRTASAVAVSSRSPHGLTVRYCPPTRPVS